MDAGRAVAGTNQFTPKQVLDAGRRAETDGKWNYAIQFYQYVVAHHPSTAEANEADVALRRLNGDEALRQHGTNKAHANGSYGAHVAVQTSEPTTPITSQLRTTQRSHSDGNGLEKSRPRMAAVAGGAAPRIKLRVKRYRLGRFTATLAGVSGFIALLVGLGALGVSVFASVVGQVPPTVLAFAFGPFVSAGLIGVGCLLILLAQMAKAIFDQAAEIAQTRRDLAD